jgi:hypothetical protein
MATKKPQPIWYTTVEGGEWLPWTKNWEDRRAGHPGARIHSIMLEDGSVFDALNGWRNPVWCPDCKRRVGEY